MEPQPSAEVFSATPEPVAKDDQSSHWRTVGTYLVRSIGGASATTMMWVLCDAADYRIALVPFVTSIIMVFGAPESPHAQSRNLIGGHIISSAVTLLTVSVLGYEPWVSVIAVGLATWLMLATRTLHPPAGMSILIIITTHAGWSYLAIPVTVGAIGLGAYAFLFFATLRHTVGTSAD